jgi:hypothetical protein
MNNKYNMLVSKWRYSYDEKSILPGAYQMKIISYSLSRLDVKLYSYSWETKIILIKLKKLGTCANSSITIMSMDPKLLFIL